MKIIEGQIVDIIKKEIFSGSLHIEDGKIHHIEKHKTDEEQYILPGFVDAHIHIESSMLTPCEYARVAMKHGTIAIVADPHEIANVCGMDGIRFMMDEGDRTPMKICFSASSCVPATPLCPAGATLNAEDVSLLLEDPRIYALAEMMNFPGVINDDPECIAKIRSAKACHKPIDGHAPLLSGEDLKKYIAAGISTDHESSSYDEAEEKIECGMSILIREGSNARNFDALHPLIGKYKEQLMFCTDDQKAVHLGNGNINKIVARAKALGYNLFDILQIATLNPVKHYHIPMGLLQAGDSADFIICDNLDDFHPKATYVNGENVFDLPYLPAQQEINNFKAKHISKKDIADSLEGKDCVDVIQVLDNELFTPHLHVEKKDFDQIQKVVVLNRYSSEISVGVGYVKGFNIRGGALAQSIAHDSHHLIATGSSDELIVEALNKLVDMQGGIVVTDGQQSTTLALPVAGLMSNCPADEVAAAQQALGDHLQQLQCPLSSPLIALSFLQLIVIPELKITDKGLFDVVKFKYL